MVFSVKGHYPDEDGGKARPNGNGVNSVAAEAIGGAVSAVRGRLAGVKKGARKNGTLSRGENGGGSGGSVVG